MSNFSRAYFKEAFGDEEVVVHACPKCGGTDPALECPLCNGSGFITIDEEDLEEPPEMQRQPLSKGTLSNYGYNSGDDYVTGGF